MTGLSNIHHGTAKPKGRSMIVCLGMALCFIMLASQIEVCEALGYVDTQNGLTQVVVGPLSAGTDDALSTVTCPSGTVIVDCYCSDPNKCDGASALPNEGCVAQNSVRNKAGIQAVAVCLKDVASKYSYVNTGLVKQRNPVVSCPFGSRAISCTIRNSWEQNYASTQSWPLPELNGVSCQTDRTCRHGQGCAAYAVCKKI